MPDIYKFKNGVEHILNSTDGNIINIKKYFMLTKGPCEQGLNVLVVNKHCELNEIHLLSHIRWAW